MECGLIEVGTATDEDSKRLVRTDPGFVHLDCDSGWYSIITVPAPWRDSPAPTWQFTAAMLRNQQRAIKDDRAPSPKQLKLELEPPR